MRKRLARRPRIGRRRYYGRKRLANKSKTGFLTIRRRLPEMMIVNTTTVGLQNFIDPTGTCLYTGAPTLNQFNSYDIPFTLRFRLDQLINFTDITNLCDAYMLKYMKINLNYLSTQTSVGSSNVMPQCIWVQDHDDASVPTSINQIREKMSAKYRTFGNNRPISIGVNPRLPDTVADVQNYFSNSGLPTKPQWLDTAKPGLEHFGIKGYLLNVQLPNVNSSSVGFKLFIVY